MTTLADRFWEKVNVSDSTQCWEWKAHTLKSGYGWMHVGNKKSNFSHRVSALLHGLIDTLDSKLHVLHRCDNPKCCNPRHLFIGTNADNVADRVSKGRTKHTPMYGEANGMVKLSEKDTQTIRTLYSEGGNSQSKLANLYGITQPQISRIVNGKRWRLV